MQEPESILKLEREPLRHYDVAQMWSGFHWQYHNIFWFKHETEFGGYLATKEADIIEVLIRHKKIWERLPGIHLVEKEDKKKPNKVNSSKERLEIVVL